MGEGGFLKVAMIVLHLCSLLRPKPSSREPYKQLTGVSVGCDVTADFPLLLLLH